MTSSSIGLVLVIWLGASAEGVRQKHGRDAYDVRSYVEVKLGRGRGKVMIKA